MGAPLITLSRLAEEASFHATAAKLLAPYSPVASAQHLKNFQTAQRQIGVLLSEIEKEAA